MELIGLHWGAVGLYLLGTLVAGDTGCRRPEAALDAWPLQPTSDLPEATPAPGAPGVTGAARSTTGAGRSSKKQPGVEFFGEASPGEVALGEINPGEVNPGKVTP